MKRQSLRARAAQRLAELGRYAALATGMGAKLDPQIWAFALASTLACGNAGLIPLAGSQRSIRWHGLDLISLRETLRRCGLNGALTDDELAETMHRVTAWQSRNGVHLIGQRKLGHLIGLTAAERAECKIITIDACDETRAARNKRLIEERRARQREAKRAERQGAHKPRDEYLRDAQARRIFCRAHHITDRTLRRWIDAGKVDVRSLSPISAMPDQGPSTVDVRSLSPHVIESTPVADTLRTPAPRDSRSDTVQLSLLPSPQATDELRAALDAWSSGPMPERVRVGYIAAKRRRALRQEDVARAIAISRPQLANAIQGTFGLSQAAADRLKGWLIADDASLPPPATSDQERPARPHHRRGGKRPPDPGPALPALRLFRVIEAPATTCSADEYDAAQERGEVAGPGGERSGREHSPALATVEVIGLTRKQVRDTPDPLGAQTADRAAA